MHVFISIRPRKHAGIDPANVNGEIQLDDAELDAALADLEQISDDDD